MSACCCLCIGSVILKLDAATADAAVELPAQTSEKKTNADMSTTELQQHCSCIALHAESKAGLWLHNAQQLQMQLRAI
jgi:hypothetical protein